MAFEVVMPKWGLSMQEGLIAQWLKHEGDTVAEGEPLLEVETEKMSNIVESPASGILARTLYPEGTHVPVTQVIALIAAPGEALSDIGSTARPAGGNGAGVAAPESPAPAPPRPAPAPTGVIPATPVARRLAKDKGIDLATVQGSGPNGMITKEDVERVLAAGPAAHPVPSPAGNVPAMPAARRLAKEKGIDLRQIRGTGPNGTITKEDVERAAAPPVTAPAGLPVQKVSFFSSGYRLDGLLYLPRDLAPGERRAGVVLCVGYTYLKSMVMPDIAKVLTAAGYIALVFDYRGFGDSEGPRWRLIPDEQVSDARAALTFLADHPQVDAARLAVIGLSLGGSNAVAAGARDPRVGAVIAIESMGDGERWLRSLRRHWEWQEFLERLARDRSERVRTGTSARVDPLEIVLADPDSRAFLEAVPREFPQMQCELPLETADALIEFRPEAVVEHIAPRPVLFIHGDADRLVPADESRHMFARAGQGRRLEIVPGIGHFDWVLPSSSGFRRVTDLIVEFMREVLPAKGGV